MAFCKNCGAEINDGAKFCKLCGAPVPNGQESQPVSGYEPSSPFEHDKKKRWGGILGLVLPVVLVLSGVGIYGFFNGSGEGDSSDDAEVSVNEMYHPNILPEEKNVYPGLWVSIGGASFPYQDLSGKSRQDIAAYIEQQMVKSDHVRYLMTDNKISVLVNGSTSLSGEYRVLDNDDLTVVTLSGEKDTIWMFVTGKDEFYTYIRYRDDDGTEMCSAMKMRRNR